MISAQEATERLRLSIERTLVEFEKTIEASIKNMSDTGANYTSLRIPDCLTGKLSNTIEVLKTHGYEAKIIDMYLQVGWPR